DVIAPLAWLGRGSPTGVVCYRHVQFPKRYRGGFFLPDWTFGRVYFVALERSGASYRCRKEIFLESVGDNGFAPTAAVVHPKTGDLFISIGGRGTRGAVYRIRYPQELRAEETAATLQVQRRSALWQATAAQGLLQQVKSTDALQRLRAVDEIRRYREHFSSAQLQEAILANWDFADGSIRKATADLMASLTVQERQTLRRRAQ